MLLSLNDSAGFLGVSTRCLKNWRERGLLPFEKIGHRIFVDMVDLCDLPLLTPGREARLVSRSWRTAKRWVDAGLLELHYETGYVSPIVSKGKVSVNEIISAKKEWERRDGRGGTKPTGKGL